MIYLPSKEIDVFGGDAAMKKKGDFDVLRKRLLSPEFEFLPPVKVDGSLSYVEQ